MLRVKCSEHHCIALQGVRTGPYFVGSVSSMVRPVLLVRLNVIHSPGTKADLGMDGVMNLANHGQHDMRGNT